MKKPELPPMPETLADAEGILSDLNSRTRNESASLYGCGYSAIDRRKAKARQIIKDYGEKSEKATSLEFPDFPTGQPEDIEKYIRDTVIPRNKKFIDAAAARNWYMIKVKEPGPMGICWFGDPHIDDRYCNWDLLYHHTKVVRDTPHLYGANIGDTTNNWIGRLLKLYANQDMAQDTAREITRWWLQESGIQWLLWLMGNHDEWNEGTTILKEMGGHVCPMEDWRARFKLVFPNGKEALIDAAHDHKGHSMYNELHGQNRAVTFERPAHLAIAGHRHCPALAKKHLPKQGMVSWLARVGAYKWADSYAHKLQFAEMYQYGDVPSVISIFNPDSESPNGFVQCFDDVDMGADVLRFLRKKHGYK